MDLRLNGNSSCLVIPDDTVMTGALSQVTEHGTQAPTSLCFIINVAMHTIITRLLHPREINASPACIIYHITISC
jgi:hypothetical protein